MELFFLKKIWSKEQRSMRNINKRIANKPRIKKKIQVIPYKR